MSYTIQTHMTTSYKTKWKTVWSMVCI